MGDQDLLLRQYLLFFILPLWMLAGLTDYVLHWRARIEDTAGTALWDVDYASRRRYVSPFEQHVHSFMEVLPLMALSFITVMYWNQFAALFGFGPETARFELHPKTNPISSVYLVALLLCLACFSMLPYAEELWRCLRSARRERQENVRQAMRQTRAA